MSDTGWLNPTTVQVNGFVDKDNALTENGSFAYADATTSATIVVTYSGSSAYQEEYLSLPSSNSFITIGSSTEKFGQTWDMSKLSSIRVIATCYDYFNDITVSGFDVSSIPEDAQITGFETRIKHYIGSYWYVDVIQLKVYYTESVTKRSLTLTGVGK